MGKNKSYFSWIFFSSFCLSFSSDCRHRRCLQEAESRDESYPCHLGQQPHASYLHPWCQREHLSSYSRQAPAQDHLHAGAATRTGSCFCQVPLPRHILQRRTRQNHEAQRSTHTGEALFVCSDYSSGVCRHITLFIRRSSQGYFVALTGVPKLQSISK